MPRRKRPLTGAADRAAARGRRSLRFPGFRAFVSLPPAHPDRRPAGQQRLHPDGAERRHQGALRLGARSSRRRSRPLPEVQDVSDDLQMKSPRVNLVINRDEAAALGLSATTSRARSTTASVRSGRRRSTARSASTEVLLELDPQYQEHADSLQKIAFKTPRRRAGAAAVGGDAAGDASGRRPSITSASCRRCRFRSACGPAYRSAQRSTRQAASPPNCCRRR